LRRLARAPIAFLAAWTIVEVLAAAALAPIASWSTSWLIDRTGRYAVANEDIAAFLLSPEGLGAAFVIAVITITGVALGRAAVLLTARECELRHDAGLPIARFETAVRCVLVAVNMSPRIALLVGKQVVVLAAVASPFVAGVVVTAWLATRNADLYWLVTIRPARYWIALGVIVPIVIVGLFALVPIVLRWSISLPLCVLQGRGGREAMRESAAMLRGRLRTVAAARLGWFVSAEVAGSLALAGLLLASAMVLEREIGSLRVTALIAALALLLHGVLLALRSIAVGVGDALICYELWRRVVPSGLDDRAAAPKLRAAAWIDAVSRKAWIAALVIAGVFATASLAALGVLRTLHTPIEVEITAHRGAAAVAPENTLAAFAAAIELGTDRIELDAMLTADGQIAVFHDTDLRRMANDRRQVSRVTMAELQTIDVGSWFGPEFSAERVPTLPEAMAAIAGASRPVPLNVELKVSGDPEPLASAVAAMLRDRGDTESVVTSLSLPALAAVRRADPDRRIGVIVTASLGDFTRVDADFYSVPASRATAGLLASAQASGREVHAWGVSDIDLFTNLALRGVDGVITNDVGALRVRLTELNELDDLERLVLAFRARLLQ
jgi:glycerophosphoryl diester phosphodiesterase